MIRLIYFVGYAYQEKNEDEWTRVRCEGCGKVRHRFEVWSDKQAKNVQVICNKACWKPPPKEPENVRTIRNLPFNTW